MNISLTWAEFKALSPEIKRIRSVDRDSFYYIVYSDQGGVFETSIIKDSGSDQVEFETDYLPFANKTFDTQMNADRAIIVDPALRKGIPGATGLTLISPDFSDRTTWYQNSTRLTDEVLTDSGGGLAFQAPLGKRNWINIHSPKFTADWGKIVKRDGTFGHFAEWEIVVKSNGTVVPEADYIINFASGTVTFTSSQAGNTIVATFSHNDGAGNPSEFLVAPAAGKKLHLEHVEVQFSKNILFNNDVVFEIWAGGALADYGDFSAPYYDAGYGQARSTYRGVRDLINWCNNMYPIIPAPNTEFTQDILCFPFRFLNVLEMRSDQGMVFRIYCKDHLPQTAEIATVTLYMEHLPL